MNNDLETRFGGHQLWTQVRQLAVQPHLHLTLVGSSSTVLTNFSHVTSFIQSRFSARGTRKWAKRGQNGRGGSGGGEQMLK
jgi:hypothetical protein